jgi:phosphoribosylaminoimidazolecarboxamide formyltransferase/IMP cyclohydrolase
MSRHQGPDQTVRERDVVPVKRALLSVSDKTGLPELAEALSAAGVEIVSTGSTAARIREAGFAVTDVSSVTGFPESLDGRVKTLHPAVHAGILADLRLESHEKQLADLGIAPFELVVVNLYPFVETVESGAAPAEVIEQIDIGGPTLVRASAKNHANVAIVVDPANYGEIIDAVAEGGTTLRLRQKLASLAFEHTAGYDLSVAAWFAENIHDPWQDDTTALATDDEILEQFDAVVGSLGDDEGLPFPETLVVEASRAAVLRYGENSHQAAALYVGEGGQGIAQATQLHGKEMSYNNYVDADAARRAALDFADPAVAVIKHANPCGIAIVPGGDDAAVAKAHEKAHACDPVSAFGGVIATNRPVTADLARQIAPIFTEVVVAPSFDDEALTILTKKKNIRLLTVPIGPLERTELRQISGGLLMQTRDLVDAPGDDPSSWQLVSGEPADEATLADLAFAWRACRSVKSNAILLAHDAATVGVGMGQVNRVDAAGLAVSRAGDRASGAVAASDAFFPFADGLQVLLDAGVRAVVEPGGSVRDGEVIDAAKAAGVTMYLTGTRHFFH